MYNSILQSRQVDAVKQKEFLKSMEAQIDKLDFLMKTMVELSRLETGIIKMQVQLQPIYNTIAQALSGIYPKAEKKKLQITIECNDKLNVKHDEKWTAEALFNILDNAVKYTNPYGLISINVSKWEFYTKIDISDNGKGIREENYGKIFERFFREPEVHNEEGVGIGLYLAREIVTKQNGYMKVNSKQGVGSTFSIFLPNE